jgi:hypothetical protein
MTVAPLSHLTRCGVPGIKRVPFGMHATRPGSHFMPGDPKECRRNAARYAELAVAARTLQLRTMFLELSKNWEKLATQQEDAFAQLGESEAIRSNVRGSLNENKRLSNLPIGNNSSCHA